MLSVLVCCFFVSCNEDTFNKSNFQEVNFTESQKIQLVTSDNVYNILVSFNENGDFNLRFLDEVPEVYTNLKIEIKNNNCKISSDDIVYEKAITEFNNDFLPKVVYTFFSETDFNNIEFTYNESDKTCFIEQSVCEKTVVFTVQLSLDTNTQNYILEIR